MPEYTIELIAVGCGDLFILFRITMKLRFKPEPNECEIEAIEMSEEQYKLLSRLVGQLSRNDLKERGFTDEQCREIESWHQCF